jgi:phosphoribosylamine--glycine ligase
MASGGYPGSYDRGLAVRGLDDAGSIEGVEVFHAGTGADDDGNIVTAGGRVLGVTALGRDLAAARASAYEAVGRIGWNAEHHRNDIALDAVERLERSAKR